jgi:hypothetical protein
LWQSSLFAPHERLAFRVNRRVCRIYRNWPGD